MLIPPGGAPRPHSAELLKHSQELRTQDALTRQTQLTAVQMREQVMSKEDEERQKIKARRKWAKERVALELKNSKQNLAKIQESWLKIMRSGKTKQLKKEVEIISQNHERDVDRKDAILQMLDRDLDEAEEQHQVAVRAHVQNVDKLIGIQLARVEGLEQEFQTEVKAIEAEFQVERDQLVERHNIEKRELQIIVQQVEHEEKGREQTDITEHQSQYELIRNRNIEEDHQMRSQLEEKIDGMRERCHAQLTNYRTTTESSTTDYHSYLAKDATLSKHVEKKLRQVERMHQAIQHWKMKIAQNRQECEERNQQLRGEKEQIQKHFQELKARMNRFRAEEKKRLVDLTVNARSCEQGLKKQLELAERILKTAELCRKLETEREKVVPFYLARDPPDLDSLNLEDDKLKEEIREAMADTGVDEWTYLDCFFKRYNKAYLDLFAVDKEKSRLEKENNQLRLILKQVLDGVSVNEEVLAAANPLLVVNGKVNLNHMPVTRRDPKPFVEAAHHSAAHQRSLVRA